MNTKHEAIIKFPWLLGAGADGEGDWKMYELRVRVVLHTEPGMGQRKFVVERHDAHLEHYAALFALFNDERAGPGIDATIEVAGRPPVHVGVKRERWGPTTAVLTVVSGTKRPRRGRDILPEAHARADEWDALVKWAVDHDKKPTTVYLVPIAVPDDAVHEGPERYVRLYAPLLDVRQGAITEKDLKQLRQDKARWEMLARDNGVVD